MEVARDIVEPLLKELLAHSGIAYDSVVHVEVAGQQIFSIQVSDPRVLVGAHGDTIHALDTLVKKMVEKKLGHTEGTDTGVHFLIDVNDYRTKQIKDLQTKALMMAERARSFQYDVELSPMSAYERLIVHTTLQNAPHVKTESQGEGRSRRVVIKYSSE